MILALLACVRTPPTPEPPVGTLADDPMIHAVRMGDLHGFSLEEGRLQAFDDTRCDDLVETLGHCLGNNPTTPYVTAYFDDFDAPLGRLTLRPDQALLFVGRTPPEALYYSLTAAVHERVYPEGMDTPVGSIAGSLHHRRILTADDTPFDAPFVAVATANRTLAQQLRRGLRPLLDRAGIATDVVNLIELPFHTDDELDAITADPAYEDITVTAIRLGEEPDDDRLSFTWRIAGADAAEAFFDADAIPQAVFRLTPLEPVEHDPWTYPLLPQLRDSSNPPPLQLQQAMVRVATELSELAQARGLQSLRLPFDETVFDGFHCIEAGMRCGNSDDALYLGSARVLLDEAPEDAGVFVVGVVHPDVPDLGMGGPRLAYSNLNLQDAADRRALTGWIHTELRGTARARFPGGIDGVDASLLDTLYIREVSRHCADPACLPLDELDTDHPLNFLERAYLDLGTGTGPHPASILEPRLVIYGPRIVPNLSQNRIDVLP